MKRQLALLSATVLALCGLAGAAWGYARGWHPETEQFPIQGVSVSAAQGAIHWPTLKAEGADIAYVQATAGAQRDPMFETNWAESRSAELRRGAWHGYNLCRDAAEQATAFIATVPREAKALPPAIVLQFEENCAMRPSQAHVQKQVATLVGMIEAHSGKHAILRVEDDFEDAYAIGAVIQRTQWRARNFIAPDQEDSPWVMWRASDFRRIDGVEGPVEWNVVRE
ncbi:GH25 family lysozyme [Sphingomonas cavernae]|uniref:GH25 family lysozyme n=1 Tax=Sphingomonas cavernae TaxID=2320861 RepID=UPI001EE5E00C|nr:GH25 family lysozyme [Sphingomonas cavernae]